MKSIFSSKTFWLAIVQAAVGTIAVFATAYPSIGGLLLAKSVVDIILRVITSQPVVL